VRGREKAAEGVSSHACRRRDYRHTLQVPVCEPRDGRHSGPPPETMFVVPDVSGQTRDRSPACGDLIFQVIGVKGTPLLLATPVVTPPGRIRLDVATAGLTPFEVEPVYVALVMSVGPLDRAAALGGASMTRAG